MNDFYRPDARRAGKTNRVRRLSEPLIAWREIGPDVFAAPPETWLPRSSELRAAIEHSNRLIDDWARATAAGALADLEVARAARRGRLERRMRRPSIERYSGLGFDGDPVIPADYIDLLDWAGSLVRRVPRPAAGATHHYVRPVEAMDEFAAACGFTWDEWQRQVLASIFRSSGAHR